MLLPEDADLLYSPEDADVLLLPEDADVLYSPEDADVLYSPEDADLLYSPEDADLLLLPSAIFGDPFTASSVAATSPFTNGAIESGSVRKLVNTLSDSHEPSL